MARPNPKYMSRFKVSKNQASLLVISFGRPLVDGVHGGPAMYRTPPSEICTGILRVLKMRFFRGHHTTCLQEWSVPITVDSLLLQDYWDRNSPDLL